jgi:hypothetical protein
MKIIQALKKKNKTIKDLNELLVRISDYNSYDADGVRPYSSKQMLTETMQMVDDLVKLKTRIHISNQHVYEKIFRMSELKNLASIFKHLDCTEGKTADRYRHSGEFLSKTSEISIIERDNIVKEIETEIEEIQSELDQHNLSDLK